MAYSDDSYYIDRIRKFNDQVAFAHLIRKHQTLVYNIALKITRSKEDAEEVAQDTFIKMYKSLNKFRGDSKFTTWLYRIAWNLAATKIRKKSHIVASTDDESFKDESYDESLNIVSSMNMKDRSHFIKLAIESLDEIDSSVITLHYMDDQSIKEISEITGLSDSNIKVKLYRSRKKIEQNLNQLLDKELHILIQ